MATSKKRTTHTQTKNEQRQQYKNSAAAFIAAPREKSDMWLHLHQSTAWISLFLVSIENQSYYQWKKNHVNEQNFTVTLSSLSFFILFLSPPFDICRRKLFYINFMKSSEYFQIRLLSVHAVFPSWNDEKTTYHLWCAQKLSACKRKTGWERSPLSPKLSFNFLRRSNHLVSQLNCV